MLCGWDELHNRFVLTDLGGVQFGWGLSERPGKRDDVHLLSKAQWEEEWRKHEGRPPDATIPPQGGGGSP